jgi:hypothetical protein
MLATVREQVARVALDRAARLASAMQPEQALVRIEALVAALDGETLSALGPEIDQVSDVAIFNAQVAAYNRALELTHAGRRAEAARVLAPVLRDARDRELLASARQLDDLSGEHLAAHDERVALRRPEPVLGARPHQLAVQGSGEVTRLVREPRSHPAPVELLERVDVARLVHQRWDGAPEGGRTDGIGHSVLQVPRDDPHQRSLAPGGRLQRCTSASR